MTDTTPPNTTAAYRSQREALGLTLREVARRTGINPGRLSIIERGVPPEPAEADKIELVLAEAGAR